jgi:site-specific DNA recombinase
MMDRPEMKKMFEDLEYSSAKPFDIVVVYKIDRLARKLKILLEITEELELYDVGFISTQEMLDTSSAF